MHFTRDPIIETIITPREGHRLVLRHASQEGNEEFFVDMLEVVSFGNAYFYRSLDKPKPFIVPAHDYEVIEVREQRMALKAPVTAQKGIKIAGGKKEAKKEERDDKVEEDAKSTRRKRRTRKKGGDLERESKSEERVETPVIEKRVPVEKPMLIPPPPLLISDTISRYKEMTAIEELALEEQFEPITHESDNDPVLP